MLERAENPECKAEARNQVKEVAKKAQLLAWGVVDTLHASTSGQACRSPW